MNTDFYSVDRLVEFGMSATIANQMILSMNQSISNMQIPGAGSNLPDISNIIYFIVIDGKQSGPYSLVELSRLIGEKRIVKETYIWKPGMTQWDLAENVTEVLHLVAITPPPVPPHP